MNTQQAPIKQQLESLTQVLKTQLDQALISIDLFGSAVDGLLGPESDLDLLVVVNQKLNDIQKQQLAQQFLQLSAPLRSAQQRALEVTILNLDALNTQSYPIQYELQYGEWLREELILGAELCSLADPDVTILLKKAQQQHLHLYGQPILDNMAEIPFQDVIRAMQDTFPSIIAHWDEDQDERNQILALCRMLYTLHFKEITAKHSAAAWFIQFLTAEQKRVLQLMIDEYQGVVAQQNWAQFHAPLTNIVENLTQRIQFEFQAYA